MERKSLLAWEILKEELSVTFLSKRSFLHWH